MSLTTLLLTNRLKINHDRIAKNIFNCYVFLIAFVAVLAVLGKCNAQDIPDVVYKARAFLPLTSDTTKPKPKVILNHYKLEGSDTLFQMLWLQVQSPADVTPRNLQKLRDWLQSSIKIDSTNGKQ